MIRCVNASPRGVCKRELSGCLSGVNLGGMMTQGFLSATCRRLFLAWVLVWAGLSGAAAADLPQGWEQGLDAALARSVREKKPVLAVFSAEWFPVCADLLREVYPQPEVVRQLRAWVPLYVDTDTPEGEAAAVRYQVEVLPTFVVLDAEGREQARFSGDGGSAAAFIEKLAWLESSLKQIRAWDMKLLGGPQASLLREKGTLLVALDQWDRAFDAFRQALHLEPDNESGIPAEMLPDLRMRLMAEREVEVLTRRLAEQPGEAALLKARGDAYSSAFNIFDRDWLALALADYRAAADADPLDKTQVWSELAFLNMFDALGETRDPEANILALDEYLQKYPQSRRQAMVLLLKSMALMSAGREQAARQALEEIVTRFPASPEALQVAEVLKEL